MKWKFQKATDVKDIPSSIIMPLIRKTMPTVIANQILGVQPMSGPTAQIHTLRVRYASDANTTAPENNFQRWFNHHFDMKYWEQIENRISFGNKSYVEVFKSK